ncbi:hypothetical protein GCM10023263_31930 [Phytohabitans rumicis]
MQVADDDPRLPDGLALKLQDQPEHAVRRRVLGTHVDDDVLVLDRVGPADDGVPVAAGDVEDLALGGLALGRVRHW